MDSFCFIRFSQNINIFVTHLFFAKYYCGPLRNENDRNMSLRLLAQSIHYCSRCVPSSLTINLFSKGYL